MTPLFLLTLSPYQQANLLFFLILLAQFAIPSYLCCAIRFKAVRIIYIKAFTQRFVLNL